jgi:hypothetical protein
MLVTVVTSPQHLGSGSRASVVFEADAAHLFDAASRRRLD